MIRHASVHAWSEDGAAMQGRAPCLWPKPASWRLRLSRTEGVLGTRGGMMSMLDPHRPPDQDPQLLNPDPWHRDDKSGCGEEES